MVEGDGEMMMMFIIIIMMILSVPKNNLRSRKIQISEYEYQLVNAKHDNHIATIIIIRQIYLFIL